MDVVLEALNTLSAVAALAYPARENLDRTSVAAVPAAQQNPEVPPAPIAKREAPVRYGRLLAHLDRERFRA